MLLVLLAFGGGIDAADLDRDGLDDTFEQRLIERFAPRFHISSKDCDGRPSEFEAGNRRPVPVAQNGTIYAQATPARRQDGAFIEIHYFHLWRNDCGRAGHWLDAEQVAALLRADEPGAPIKDWRAVYWYAAAHEGTVCDLSSGAMARVVSAEKAGPNVWVSRGKHATYLSRKHCGGGCGGDECTELTAIDPPRFVNIGEREALMNGAGWVESTEWKMREKFAPVFNEDVVKQLEGRNEIVSLHLRGNPAHAVILAGGETGAALRTADSHTENALGVGTRATSNSIKKAHKSVIDFLSPKKK